MADNVALPPLDTVDNSSFIEELNNNLDILADEFDLVIYKDGHEAMEGDLDMGSNRIFNLAAPVGLTEPLRLGDVGLFDAENPNYTYVINTLAPGSQATLVATGTYPNVTLTFGIPRGDPGASGALGDGNYGGITVSGTGSVFNVNNSHITLARMADLGQGLIIGRAAAAGTGAPQALTASQVKTVLSLTKSDVGLDNVDNTADTAKPVSTAQQAALDLKSNLASPAFTGNPTAPTPTAGDNDTSIATTAFVQAAFNQNEVHTVPVMAGSMITRSSNGAVRGLTETSTNKLMYDTVDFNKDTDAFAQFWIPMPKGWDEGTVTAQFVWASASGTGNVIWSIQAVAISDDDLLDPAFGTAVSVTDGVTAASDLMQSAFTSAITIAGTPAAEDMVLFQVSRDADNVSDTLSADARLLAVRVKFTRNARDDS